MEASVDQVVGWLQRTALWLAGIFMLLQTRTIRNKFAKNWQGSWIFVATVQQTAHAVDAIMKNGCGLDWHAAQQQKLSDS